MSGAGAACAGRAVLGGIGKVRAALELLGDRRNTSQFARGSEESRKYSPDVDSALKRCMRELILLHSSNC